MQGTLLAGRYLLAEVIGAGGMGTVYRATDVRTGAPVAVKVIHPALAGAPEYASLLGREARIAASLISPRIVRVIDLDEHAGVPFLVMEFVPGATLRDLLRIRGRLTLVEALIVALEVAHALTAAYAHGVVHRDLKPQNVKLLDGHVKVLDFGIAKVEGVTGVTTSNAYVGTVEYSAPERVSGRGDIRADIYALGVMLYEMLEGRPPFRAETALAVLRQHETASPPPLSGDVPAPVRAIIARCLEKDPAARYQTPADLAADLAATIRDLPDHLAAMLARMPSALAAPESSGGAAPGQDGAPAANGSNPSAVTGTLSTPLFALAGVGEDGRAGGPVAPWREGVREADTTAVTMRAEPGAVMRRPPRGVGRRSASETRRRRLMWLLGAAGAVVLAGALALAVAPALPGWGGDEPAASGLAGTSPAGANSLGAALPPSATVSATPSATPTPGPVVSGLKVYDNVFTKRVDQFEVGESVVACFTIAPQDDRPLMVVATDRSTQPRDAGDPTVVARSEPVSQAAGDACVPVKFVAGAAAPGPYWVWVLRNSELLAQGGFRVLPAVVCSGVWKAEYFNVRAPQEAIPAVSRCEGDVRSGITWSWGRGSPAPGVNVDDFSARWTGAVRFEGGTYRFSVDADDGFRLWIDDALVIDAWKGGPVRVDADVELTAGTHQLRAEYFEVAGDAYVDLHWEKAAPTPTPTPSPTPTPTATPAPTVATEVIRQAVEARGYVIAGPPVTVPLSAGGSTLTVQLGRLRSAPDGLGNLLFIFVDGRFLGTDTESPSKRIRDLRAAGPGRFSAVYDDYAPGDLPCCPSRPSVTITYTLDGDRLVPSSWPPPGHTQ